MNTNFRKIILALFTIGFCLSVQTNAMNQAQRHSQEIIGPEDIETAKLQKIALRQLRDDFEQRQANRNREALRQKKLRARQETLRIAQEKQQKAENVRPKHIRLTSLAQLAPPQEITTFLDKFFANPDVKQLILSSHIFTPTIRTKYGIENLGRNNVLRFTQLPGWIIKCCLHLNDKTSNYNRQNISRIFYNEKIKEIIEKEGLTHIMVVQKFLYHIPGRPDELCDANYLVVVKEIPFLSSPTTNATQFKKLTFRVDEEIMERSAGDYVKPEYENLLIEIIQVVTYTGLFDLHEQNIFLITQEDGSYKFLIIDTEQPPLDKLPTLPKEQLQVIQKIRTAHDTAKITSYPDKFDLQCLCDLDLSGCKSEFRKLSPKDRSTLNKEINVGEHTTRIIWHINDITLFRMLLVEPVAPHQ